MSSEDDKIIQRIQKQIEEFGRCSIQQVAEEVVYSKISMSEQVKLAKRLAKERAYVTEKKGSEIFVMKNESYRGYSIENESENDYKVLKSLIVLIAAALGYLVFHYFLPNLKSNTSPASANEKIFIVDSASSLEWKRFTDSVNNK